MPRFCRKKGDKKEEPCLLKDGKQALFPKKEAGDSPFKSSGPMKKVTRRRWQDQQMGKQGRQEGR